MAKNKEEKTNVMRTLDQKKIAYIPHAYDPDGPSTGCPWPGPWARTRPACSRPW